MMNERRDVGLVDHVLFAQLSDHETQVGHQREHETRHRMGELHDQIIPVQLKNKKLTFLIKQKRYKRERERERDSRFGIVS